MKETNQLHSGSFFETIHFFAREYLMICVYIADFDVTKYVFTKKLYSKLISSSQLLEDLLDYHGAKNNKNWYLRTILFTVVAIAVLIYISQYLKTRDTSKSKGTYVAPSAPVEPINLGSSALKTVTDFENNEQVQQDYETTMEKILAIDELDDFHAERLQEGR